MSHFFFAAIVGVVALGYLALAVLWVPRLRLSFRAKVLGSAFFVTCAFTHIEQTIHSIEIRPEFYTDAHMLLIHTTQALVVMLFVFFVKPWRVVNDAAQQHGLRTMLATAYAFAESMQLSELSEDSKLMLAEATAKELKQALSEFDNAKDDALVMS